MKIKTLITLHANGQVYAPGSMVDLADEEAQRVVSRGFAAIVKKEPVISTSAPHGQSSQHKRAPTIEDIVDVIAALDPVQDFGKNGKPHVEALEDLLGANITATQRDQAWERFRQDQSEDGAET